MLQARVPRRQLVGGALAAAGTAALVAACGGSKGASARRSSSAGGSAGNPRSGGTLTTMVNTDPFNLDPTGKPVDNAPFIILAYNCLLTAQFGPGMYTKLVLRPELADRWETPDGQNFTFHLHPGVKFADLPPVNGRGLTSADVKWSLEYLSRTGQFKGAKLPPSINDSQYEGLESVEAPDDLTVNVHFNAPFVPFLAYMAEGRNQILPHEIFDQYGDFVTHMVGTGPWQIDQPDSQSGQRWVFKKNPDYFVAGHPYLDQVEYLVLKDDATQIAAFRTKQIDILSKDVVTVANMAQIQKDNPSAVMGQFSDTAGGHLFMNVRHPPLNDIRIRRAIALSIDRDEFIKVFSNGKGDWALAGDFPGLFTQQEVKQIVKYDPAEARQLVSAAGFPSGVELEFMTPGPDRGQDYANMVQLIQAQLKKGNVNATLKVLDQPTQSQRLKQGNYQLEYETKQRLGDLDAYLFYTFYSKSTGNYGGIDDSALDALLLAQRRETDPAKRSDIQRQAVRRIADQAWSVSFFYGTKAQFWQAYVKDFYPSALYYSSQPVFNTWLNK
jgi:peptide/nickel transport system substrate-binding protein